MTPKNSSSCSAQRRPLHPSDLALAPELAALAIIEGALHTALVALCAAHPTLQDFAQPAEPPCLRRARRLVSAAANLDRVLHSYRSAVYDTITPLPTSYDDIPF